MKPNREDAVESLVGTAAEAAALLQQMKSGRDRVDEILRRAGDHRMSLQGGDTILAAIPDFARPHLAAAEIMNRCVSAGRKVEAGGVRFKGSFFAGDPPLQVAVGAWLRGHLTKLSNPGAFYSVAEQHAKLTTALNEGIEKVALQEDVAAEGGNLVPVVVQAEILRLIADNGILRALVRKVTMTVKTHAYPTRAAAFSAAIIAEEGSITDSIPASPFSQSNLTAKKLASFATVSGELLQDNVVLLGDYLATEFSEQQARLEDTQALEGDGTGVNFTGVVAASGVNAVTSGANGDKVYWQKLVDTIFAGSEASTLDGAGWFMAPSMLKTLYKSRADAVTALDNAGLPLFAPAAGIGPRFPKDLGGFQLFSHSGILTNRAVGTGTNRTNIYFGPPRTIIFGDLLGFSVDMNPYSKFQTFQMDIRGVRRMAILVGVPAAWTKYTAIDPLLLMAP